MDCNVWDQHEKLNRFLKPTKLRLFAETKPFGSPAFLWKVSKLSNLHCDQRNNTVTPSATVNTHRFVPVSSPGNSSYNFADHSGNSRDTHTPKKVAPRHFPIQTAMARIPYRMVYRKPTSWGVRFSAEISRAAQLEGISNMRISNRHLGLVHL